MTIIQTKKQIKKFKTLIPRSIEQNISVNNNSYLSWEFINNDKFIVEVKELTDTILDDLKFAKETDEALKEIEEKDIKRIPLDKFLKDVDLE